MKKKSYIISVITVFVVCFIVICVRIKIVAEKHNSNKVENESVVEEETTTEYVNIMDVVDELPEYEPGYLKDLKMKFEWSEFPEVKDYDPDNKVAKNGCYGYTTAEGNERGGISKEVDFYDRDHELPVHLQGKGIYNKEIVYQKGENFELKSERLTGKADNVKIADDVLDLEEEFFFDIDKVNEALKNNQVLVTVDIELTSSSNWVVESDIVPTLIYLSDNGDCLKVIEEGMNEEGIYEEARPVYYDLGFYDLDTEENCFLYPMRREESVSFKVGYLVDKDKMDNAYFHYDTYATEHIENSYNYIYDVLVKLDEK